MGVLLATGLLSCAVARAGDPVEAWVARYNGPGPSKEVFGAATFDLAGNTYMTGTSNGDVYTVKVSPAGQVLWASRYYTGDSATLRAIAVDAAGSVWVAGDSGSGDRSDYLIIKYDSSGARQWTASYGSPEGAADNLRAAAVDAEGRVYVTGAAGAKLTTVCYDVAGVRQWVSSYGTTGGGGWDLKLASDGSLVVTGGYTFGTGWSDAITIKYDTAGNPQWVARYDPDSTYFSGSTRAVAFDSAGNIYVCGTLGLAVGGTDIITIKYDAGGVQQWAAIYNGQSTFSETAMAIGIDAAGNVYVVSDYDTIKYDTNGHQLWTLATGGADIAVDPAGNIFLAAVNGGVGGCRTVACDSNGAQLWTMNYGGQYASSAAGHAIALDNQGNVHIAGEDPRSNSLDDYLAICYHPDGVQQWLLPLDGQAGYVDVPVDLAVDAGGNVCVTGYSIMNNSREDITTLKYNPSGQLLWTAMYDGPQHGTDKPARLKLDPAGNLYIAGTTEDGQYADAYVTLKYSPAGTKLWEQRYQASPSSGGEAAALALDTAANVYVTGTSATVKYDSNGNQKWVAASELTGKDLAVDAAGNVYVTGTVWQSATGTDFKTVKYNSAGVKQWAETLGSLGFSTDEPNAIGLDAAGNIYVSGYYTRSAFPYPMSWGLAMYRPSGGYTEWENGFQGPGSQNQPVAMFVDPGGNTYLTGNSWNSGAESLGIFTLKFGPTGTRLWQACYPAASTDRVIDLAVDNVGNAYVVARYRGTGNDIITVKYNRNGQQQWVMRYNSQSDPSDSGDAPAAVAVDAARSVYVAGLSPGRNTNADIVTIKYLQPNDPPVAACQNLTRAPGADCHATVTGAEVGAGSSDPEGGPLNYSLSPAGPYPMGTTAVLLTVTDDQGATASCTAQITVAGDGDSDGICDAGDNCPASANADQADADHDGIGDVCDPCTDIDGDGFGNPGFAASTCPPDNCPTLANPNQADADSDGTGDLCDSCTDTDRDGAGNPGFPANTCPLDGCPADSAKASPGVCGCGVPDTDADSDGILDCLDNCPGISNSRQQDRDRDGVGDACDNCQRTANADQADADHDGLGDACDTCTDTDGDGFGNPGFSGNACAADNCPALANPGQADTDSDGLGDSCDNCPTVGNPDQSDADNDRVGNSCDLCPNSIPGVPVDAQGCPAAVRGDFDRDGDVDDSDLEILAACLSASGPAIPHNGLPACITADAEGDHDVDMDDFGAAQRCYSGANNPANADCQANP